MPNVYVVQRPSKEMDFSSAHDYGAIRFVLEDPRFQPSQQPGVAQKIIDSAVMEFNPDKDYLIAVGSDWSGVLMMGMALSRRYPGRPIKILRWERFRDPKDPRKGFYTPSTVRM